MTVPDDASGAHTRQRPAPGGWRSRFSSAVPRLGSGESGGSVVTPFVRRAAWIILTVGGLIPLAWLLTQRGHGYDFYAYWSIDPAHPYVMTENFGAFHYPPPFVWLFAPLRLVSFETGYLVWTAFNVGALIWLTRRWALAWLLFPPVTTEIFHGNIHLLIAAALVLGFRFTAAWTLVALAKITTSIIGLWPLLRGEWRAAAVLAATVAVISVPSLIVAPGLWAEWISHLFTRSAQPIHWGAEIGIPLLIRLVAALVLILWGSRRDRRWVLAPVVALAMPILWVHGLAVLAAIPRLRGASPWGPAKPLDGRASPPEREGPV